MPKTESPSRSLACALADALAGEDVRHETRTILRDVESAALTRSLGSFYSVTVLESRIKESELRRGFEALAGSRPSADPEQDVLLARVIGMLGYVLLCLATDRWQAARFNSKSSEDASVCGPLLRSVKAECDGYLADERVVDLILERYGIDRSEIDLVSGLEFWRAGTTSLILLTKDLEGASKVLKVVKFQYWENHRIIDQTLHAGEAFKKVHNKLPVPVVRSAGRRWVLMDFLPGLTLREYMEDLSQLPDDICEETRLRVGYKVLTSVVGVLKTCADRPVPIYHYDLSPDNIIINETEHCDGGGIHVLAEDIEHGVSLIDWGFNYLLTAVAGGSGAISQLRSYVAPELPGNPRGSLSDIYSLGNILLEVLGGDSWSRKTRDRGYMLEDLWSSQPGLASLVEDLIDEEPENRLIGNQFAEESRQYDHLLNQLKLQYFLIDELSNEKESSAAQQALKTTSSIFEVSSGINLGVLLAARTRLKKLRIKAAGNRDEEVHRARKAFIYLAVAQFANLLTIFLIIEEWLRVDRAGGADLVLQNLAARIVCLTFIVTATNYYVNIFSQVSAEGLERPGTEWWMRQHSWILSVPILIATIINPQLWPFMSALGIFFVAINNYLTHRLAAQSDALVTAKFRLPRSSGADQFLKDYNRWSWLMGVYGGALLVIGGLLWTGLATDALVYGVIAAAMNVKLIIVNCNQSAPWVTAGLLRNYSGARRVSYKAGHAIHSAGIIEAAETVPATL